METVTTPELKTTTKTMDELNKEFGHLCAQAGQAQFEMKVLENKLFDLNKKIHSVNLEALSLKTAQDAQKGTAHGVA